jgi:uncharacterized protein
MGSGCTSGHGICGLAAFRLRSMIATPTFMITGMATSMIANTSSYFPFFKNELAYTPSFIVVSICVFVSIILYMLSYYYHTTDKINVNTLSVRVFKCIAEALYGITFSIALGVANMTQPSATLSFLDLRYWNPALAFVMIGGLFVTGIAFNYSGNWNEPFLDKKFYRPTSTDIDFKLIAGAILFGVGWGLSGSCPGPTIANIGAGNIYSIIFGAFVILGVWTYHITEMSYFDDMKDYINKKQLSVSEIRLQDTNTSDRINP